MTQPSKNELLYLKNDRVMKWVLEHLSKQFRPLKPYELARSWEQTHLFAGQQQVISALHRLLDPEAPNELQQS